MKKTVALLLAALLLFTIAIPAFAADTEPTPLKNLPTVYIYGRTDTIYANYGTPDEKVVWSSRVPIPDGYISDMAKELLPLFAKAVLRNDYSEWAEKFSQILVPIYQDIVLDTNAQPQPGSTNGWKVPETLEDERRPDGTFDLWSYSFKYDWRLDPLQVAESLETYIDRVLNATGAQKVNLMARCEGSSILLAYLFRCGADKVACALTIGASMNGCMEISDAFGGDINLSSEAANRYIARYLGSSDYRGIQSEYFKDEAIVDYLKATVALMTTSSSLEPLIGLLTKLYEKVKPMVYPGLLMSSYGTFPGYWAMVDDAHYETAKTLAGLDGNETWAPFVKVIDYYHYNVLNHCADILKSCADAGMYYGNFVKYGMDALPLFGEANKINDRVITAEQASMGATCALINETLPADYLAKADSKYISVDGQIDASTSAFPDTTWYVKYCDHSRWSGLGHDWMQAVLDSNGTLAADDTVWQRFLAYDYKTGVSEPLTAANSSALATNEITSPLRAVLAQGKAFLGMLRYLLRTLWEKLGGAA